MGVNGTRGSHSPYGLPAMMLKGVTKVPGFSRYLRRFTSSISFNRSKIYGIPDAGTDAMLLLIIER